MSMEAVFKLFSKDRPVAMMAQVINQEMISEDLDVVFDEHRDRQYQRELLFSYLTTAVADVVMGVEKSPNKAYIAHRKELIVSKTAFYDKLNKVEPAISEAMVRHAFSKACDMQDLLGFVPTEPVRGYHARIVDGNHLQKTEKRITELRGIASAALPGTAVAMYSIGRELFECAYLLEDAHAQESSTLERLLDDLQPRDLIIGDRHFCIVSFLLGIIQRRGAFIIRQHGRLQGELQGQQQKIGRVENGVAYEQAIVVGGKTLRRVTVKLDEETRDGETEIHILTNLPVSKADARKIADVYRQRWEVENGFYVLTTALTCEVKSLGHPRAALFVFCTAMLAFNSMRVLCTAMTVVWGEAVVADLSAHSLSVEISKAADGLNVLRKDGEWNSFLPTSPRGLAKFLLKLAEHVDISRHKKSHRGPKKTPPKRTGYRKGGHVATARILGLVPVKSP